MKTDANWCVRVWTLLLILTMAFATLSCGGGGGGSVDLTPGDNSSGTSGTRTGGGQLISEDEISTLPAWQQEMLSDPGWNQPYIPPREETPMPAPSYDMLIEETQKALEQGRTIEPRVSGVKGASWNDQKGYVPPTNVAQGEYQNVAPTGVPTFGCNDNGTNSNSGHAIEDVIDAATMLLPQRISYVEEGWSTANYFNETGGTGNDAQSAVYQLFATDRSADPTDPGSTAEFGELSYRADLAPGVGPGGDCSAAEAFSVADWYWKVFNSDFSVLPMGSSTPLYNILIAPQTGLSPELTSSSTTIGRYQEFYFGSISSCYGGSYIVGLISSTSECEDFNQNLIDAANTGFYVRPIYGVLLKRWQDGQITGQNGPWESNYGWPVFGPVAYGGGTSVLTPRGTYYAWGMWFERGFCWWVDYDQDAYPNTPDEAQMYAYSGSNVYCRGTGDDYIKQQTIYYGGEGDLGVSVVVDSYRYDLADPWIPAPLNSGDNPGTYYEIGVNSGDGLGLAIVALHAHGYGGLTKDDPTYGECLYKNYIWAFRDGLLQLGTNNYDPDQAYVQHTYGDLLINKENVYVVRVQITDASFDLGADTVEHRAFGDSLPIHLGHGGGGGGGGEIWLIRNDGGTYDTNYDALVADLNEIGASWSPVDYSATVAADFNADEIAKVAIWYRGGPGATGEPNQAQTWTNEEINQYRQLTADAHKTLLLSQGLGIKSMFIDWGYTNIGWTQCYGVNPLPSILTNYTDNTVRSFHWTWGVSNQNGFDLGLQGRWKWSVPTDWTGTLQEDNILNFNAPSSASAAERYSGAGSSGIIPLTLNTTANPIQASGIGWIGSYAGRYGATTLTSGMGINRGLAFAAYPDGFISWGNPAAPNTVDESSYPYDGAPGGPGKAWVVTAPWNRLTVTTSTAGGAGSMSRAQLLQNILGWLDSALTFGGGGGGGGGGFSEYEGDPEIVMVMATSWFGTGGVTPGAQSYTGVHYPDSTGTDVFRDSPPGPPPATTDYIYDSVGRTAVESGVNANDLDFQFPFYGYVYDADGSLTSGTPAVNGDEKLVLRGGLLVDNPTLLWTRVDPGMAGYVNWDTNSGLDPGILPPGDVDTDDESDWQDEANWMKDVPWAGYYVTSVDVITNPGLDDGVRATYGTQPASMTFLSLDEPLSFETIAHWPPTTTYLGVPGAARLGWSLYPGHTAFPTTNPSQYFGEISSWVSYVVRHDIDPLVPTPPADRDNSLFLYHNFYYNQQIAVHGGRVVDYDFSSILNWDGDLDMDGTPGEDPDDKFPARVRLLSDQTFFIRGAGPFPDQWPNKTTILEGGCYIVDNSAAGSGTAPIITPVETPTSEAAGFNIRWIGTYPSAPEWEVDVTYTIEPGAATPIQIAYDIDGDITLDPANFDSDVMGTPRTATGTYTETISFTAGDITDYVWSNGDELYLVIRGINFAGIGMNYFNVPLWLGDVIYFENFEGDQHAIPVIDKSVPNWYPPGPGWEQPQYTDKWCYYKQAGTVGEPWVAPVTSRAWLNEHANQGTNCLWWDNGDPANPFYNMYVPPYTYRAPVWPQRMAVPNQDEPYQHFRMAAMYSSINYWGFAKAVYLPAYGYSQACYNTAGGQALSGLNPTSSIRSHYGTETYPNDNSWYLQGGYVRIGLHAYTWYQAGQFGPPGGGMADNMLWTHASNYPPYL